VGLSIASLSRVSAVRGARGAVSVVHCVCSSVLSRSGVIAWHKAQILTRVEGVRSVDSVDSGSRVD
jgi:hypothetical protein